MKNLYTIDRIARVLLGVVVFQLAYFWVSGALQIAAYLISALLFATAAIRFCPVYRLFGINSKGVAAKTSSKLVLGLSGALLLLVLLGGSYASAFYTRKLFLEDFNAMNNYYKQTLFLTGKNERESAIANYDKLVPSFQKFQDKYTRYQPFSLKGDKQIASDLDNVSGMIAAVNALVRSGDLHQAHLDLEKVRPVFQDIFKRNGFSMLSVALVDFHDSMELILDAANAKDQAKVISLYPQVSDLLKAIEAEANDSEIQKIRTNLDELRALAKSASGDKMPAKSDDLKASFVKVYLKRG